VAVSLWPASLRESEASWWIAGAARSGGRATSGVTQLVRRDGGGFWRADLSEIPVYTADQIRAYRGILASLDSGASPIIVPVTDICQPYLGQASNVSDDILHGDLTPFSDEVGYVNEMITAELGASASLRATNIRIIRRSMAQLRGGEYFSIDHTDYGRRLYIVTKITDTSGLNTWVDIRPPLRGDLPNGTILDFAYPSCTMLVANPEEAALRLKPPWHGRPSISFIEYLPPTE
jgi:hypothetical protein